jgi:hypothetical protein
VLISEAFKAYGAKQKNIQWSVSAFNDKDELVVSLWKQYFKLIGKDTQIYVDKVSRWQGLGNDEFRKNIALAHATDSVIKVIIARSAKPKIIDAGGSGANLGNTFAIKKDWFGKVKLWDGDNFEIEFVSSTR